MFKKRISYLALLSVVLCVFIVVVVMTVMRGLVTDFKVKTHSFVGDCVVGTESLVGFAYYEDFVELLEAQEYVEAVSPVIKSFGLLSPDWTDKNFGAEIIGVDPIRHSKVTGFADTLYFNKGLPSEAFRADSLGCVYGIDMRLARDAKGEYVHGVRPGEETLSLSCVPLTAKGALAKSGVGMINMKTFYYSDTSRSGLARVDGSTIYVSFDQLQLLCGMDSPDKRTTAIHIKFKDDLRTEEACARIEKLWAGFIESKKTQSKADLLEKVRVQSWKQNRRSSIAAMEKEQTMMTVMFMMVGVTTIFVVLVVFYMITSHKTKDIGILKSVGASTLDIVKLFSGFAFLVGGLGSLIGLGLGCLFLNNITRIEDWLFERFGFQLWNRAIYSIGEIPNKIEPGMLLVIAACAIFACMVGSLIPSIQAANCEPAKTLQVSQL
jgi:lipoprotein-releasing system permease protein